MSDLRTLPPVVEKVWITVDYSRISVVSKFLKVVLREIRKVVCYEFKLYAHLQLVYPHLFNSATRF